MKKFILLLWIPILFACSDSDDNPSIQNESNKVLLLQVDFTTNVLEGAKELTFTENNDNFTISYDYLSPGDFGNITLYYQELDEMIFDGQIIWLGTGFMSFPENFTPASALETVSESVEMPPINSFQNVDFGEQDYYPEDLNYSDLWNAIDNLALVSEYRTSNPDGMVNVFLYTPSVGVGDPEEWDYFVILKN